MEPESLTGPHAATPTGKPRARSLGIPFGGTPGRWNAITDVPGVQVGYTTLIRGTRYGPGSLPSSRAVLRPAVTRWRRPSSPRMGMAR
jgi:hypothetical protein